jgi:hypothetical protein
MADPEESTPSYVRNLDSGAEPVAEPLDLDTNTFHDLAQRVREIEASRAHAAVSGREYVIR